MDRIKSDSPNLLYEGQPIPYFGNIGSAEIATVGLNPSDKEFYCDKNIELINEARRFQTLSSLRLNKWENIKSKEIKTLKQNLDNYFQINPYKRWFNQLERIFSTAGYSYYDNTACHIDLIPYTTKIKWSSLKSQEQRFLLDSSTHDLKKCIEHSNINALILNGASVINGFLKSYDIKLKQQKVPSWEVKTKKGNISGIKYKGILRLNSGKEILVIGFNYNLQSSFGLTNEIKANIRKWTVSELNSLRKKNEA